MVTTLTDCAIVITGASSGIGRAMALAFARHGAHLAIAARRKDVLEEVAQECRLEGGEAIAVQTDVIDLESVNALARTAEKTFGGLDVWVNNAGTGVLGTMRKFRLNCIKGRSR